MEDGHFCVYIYMWCLFANFVCRSRIKKFLRSQFYVNGFLIGFRLIRRSNSWLVWLGHSKLILLNQIFMWQLCRIVSPSWLAALPGFWRPFFDLKTGNKSCCLPNIQHIPMSLFPIGYGNLTISWMNKFEFGFAYREKEKERETPVCCWLV
jgi:hypothetical protein